MNEDKSKNEPKTLNEDKPKNEPETLCIAWLSSCQQFSFVKELKQMLRSGIDLANMKHDDMFDTLAPIVGAVAVRYKHDNSFSVFIGIAMGANEEKDIAYIKSMGQRTTESIARGIFPQFDDMTYHN